MTNWDELKECCEMIDAAVFTGDAVYDIETWETLMGYLGAWQRRVEAALEEIEEERREEEYQRLIQRVQEIDPEAAAYMGNEAREQETFYACGLLNGAFIWEDTPQGKGYWRGIYDRLLPEGNRHD